MTLSESFDARLLINPCELPLSMETARPPYRHSLPLVRLTQLTEIPSSSSQKSNHSRGGGGQASHTCNSHHPLSSVVVLRAVGRRIYGACGIAQFGPQRRRHAGSNGRVHLDLARGGGWFGGSYNCAGFIYQIRSRIGSILSFARNIDGSYVLIGTRLIVGRGSDEVYRLGAFFDGEIDASKCRVEKDVIVRSRGPAIEILVATKKGEFPVETPGSLGLVEVVAEVVNIVGVRRATGPVYPLDVAKCVGKPGASHVGPVPSSVVERRIKILG